MKRSIRRRLVTGFTVLEVLTVVGLISQIPQGAFATAKGKGVQTECVNNLKQVGQMLKMYEMENGFYPKAAFYPKNPKSDPDSIRVILSDVPEKLWLCPAMPDALKDKGLTFVYNDTLAGRREADFENPAKKWVLIEVTCVSGKAPAPHVNGYNVLFADGHVITTNRLPSKITAAQQAQLDQLRHGLHGGVMVASDTH